MRVAALLLSFAIAGGLDAQYYSSFVQVPRSVLERYAGEYVYPEGNTVMVVLRGDTLYREIPGQSIPLVAISHTRFKLGPVFIAEFVTDQSGAVTQVLSDGMEVEYRLPRKGSVAAAAPVVAAVRVSREVLQRYVGEYEFVPGQMRRTDLFIVVRLRGDTLTRKITGGPERVLVPLSETRFNVAGTSLESEFVIGSDGSPLLVMGSGEQQMRARLKPLR